MDSPRDGCGRLRMYHSYQDCANITEGEFQKIVELEDAGVALYRWTGLDPTQNITPIYILRTDDDLELNPDEFPMAFANNKISCPRCIRLIEKAEMSFNKLSHVKLQDIKGVCEHCWKPVAELKRLAELARKERDVKDSAGVETLNAQMLRPVGTKFAKKKRDVKDLGAMGTEPKQRPITLKSPRTPIEREPKERVEKEERLKSHETRSSARAEDKARAGQKKEEKSKAKEEKQEGKEEKSIVKENKTEEIKYKSKEKEEEKIKDKDDKSKDTLEKSKDKEDKVKDNEEKQKSAEVKDELKLQKEQMAKENKEVQQRQKQQDDEKALAEKKQVDAEKPKESPKNKESTLKPPTLPSPKEDVKEEKIKEKEVKSEDVKKEIKDKAEKSVDKEDKVEDKEKKHKGPPLKSLSGNELKRQMAQIEKENKEAQQRQKQQEQAKALAEKKARDAEKESQKNKESKLKPPTLPTPKEDVEEEKIKEKEVKSEDKEIKEKEPPLGNELMMQLAQIAKEQQAAQMRRKQQEHEKELAEKRAREAERQLEEQENKEPKLEPPKLDFVVEEDDDDEDEIYDTYVPLPLLKIIIGDGLFKQDRTKKEKSEDVQDLGKPVKVQSPKSLKAGKVTNIDSGKTGKVQDANNTKEEKLNKDIPGQKKEQGQQEAKKNIGDASKASNLVGKVTNMDSKKTGKVLDNDSGKTGKVQDTNNSKEEKLNKDIPGQKKEQGQQEAKRNIGDASKTSNLVGKVTNIDSKKTGKVLDNDSGKTGKVQDTNNSKEEKLNKDIPGQKKEQGQQEAKRNIGDASKTSNLVGKVTNIDSKKTGKVLDNDSGKTGKVQDTNNTKEEKLNKDIPGQKKEQGQQEAKKNIGDASKTSNLAGKATNIDSRKTGKVSDNDSGKTGKVQDTNNTKEEKLNKDIPEQKKEQGQQEPKINSGDASKTSNLAGKDTNIDSRKTGKVSDNDSGKTGKVQDTNNPKEEKLNKDIPGQKKEQGQQEAKKNSGDASKTSKLTSETSTAKSAASVKQKTDTNTYATGDREGVIRYALSDRNYIENGWTLLPVEKIVRKMNVYRMRPAHPEFDWFGHRKNRLLEYDSGEKLAEIDESGRGRWYYRSGKLAMDYYDAEETNAGQRFVVYSTGTPDDRGRLRPRTVLATFDYLGNGIVFDHAGKIRLKYNQTEGVVLDRALGPVSHWKWHSLNDPPVLQQVMIDTHMSQRDPKIMKMGPPNADAPRTDDDAMLAIEFDNFVKEKTRKSSQKFKPFQIKMKALKINEYFSLRVMDQACVYLQYRDGSANIKINIGMVLDHKEIIDTETADIADVSNKMDTLPACTNSIKDMQKAVAHAKTLGNLRALKELHLRGPPVTASVDLMLAPASRPLRPPLTCATSHITLTANKPCSCSCNP